MDTGYNTIEDVRYAKSLGMEVIVTDHHKTVKEKFDDEILYLNPKLSKTYKFQYLSTTSQFPLPIYLTANQTALLQPRSFQFSTSQLLPF